MVQIRSYLLQRSQRLLSLRRFWVPDMDWAGRTTGQRTVNLFTRQTKKSVLNGLVLTFMTILCKHPVKVHVWAGIGWHGATEICIFDGIMDAAMYVRIVQVALLPTLQCPEYEKGHHFIQDNNPKHNSGVAKAFFADSGVNWWRTPPPPPRES